ncbi:MAG: phage capsid protein [Nitrospira sp.]
MNGLIESAKDHVLNLRIKAEERGRAGGADATQDALHLSLEADRMAERIGDLEAITEYIRCGKESKALQTGTGPQGGYAVPTVLSGDVLLKPSGATIGQLCTHRTLTKGDGYPLPTIPAGPTVGFYDEDEDYADDGTFRLASEVIPIRNLGTRIPVSSHELGSVAEDFTQWLTDTAAPAFDEKLDEQIIIGDGIKSLEGALVAKGVSEVPSGNASTLTADGIRKLFFGLKAPYRLNATWAMNSQTAELVRGLKDTSGMPIYNESQDTIFRRPIAINESMPDVAAGSSPIIVGDWRFYWIVTRMALSVFRNPYKRKPLVLFDLTKRVGGQVVFADAFAKQKVST